MKNILLVDDDYLERKGIRSLFERFGWNVNIHEEKNGADALNYLNGNRDIDIVITDIEMPHMDGLELCAKVRMLYPQLKIVILSAYSKFEYAQTAIEYNVTSYLLKPVKIEDFIRVMGKCLPGEIAKIPQANFEDKRKIIRDIKAIIEADYKKDISVEYIASKIYLSPCYISSIFKKEVGISLIKYLNTYRLNKAEILLSNTNMRIKEISNEVGFNNVPYFVTVFKEKYGMTPSEFREYK